ncbi:MAG: VOC family protein [Pseudomonadota bacterium]
MKYLHTMVRVTDIEASKAFYCGLLGLEETRRIDRPEQGFTLVFLSPPGQEDAAVELTYNHGSTEEYGGGRNFGHLAYEVEDIYATCEHLRKNGVTINRPPRDGRMAFVRSPDGISVELLQMGEAQPAREPWASMENVGTW